MDKKKKPPPGATLIQRLKEARLRREQAEAAAQSEAASGSAQVSKAAGVAPEQTEHKTVANDRKTPTQRSNESAGAETTAAVTRPKEDSLEAPKPSLKKANPDNLPVADSLPAKPQADLIRRAISIDDLRPHSDDYDQLTEEIRLAGRFAAAGLIAQGLRLARLKDESLYKDRYGTFEEYCRSEHTMTATYAYRLIRMAEMADRIAAEGHKGLTASSDNAMPDPFEVMLGLGHRHIMALLPLETERAEELLVKGVPLTDATGKPANRIPIGRATEQQIRQAIGLYVQEEVEKAVKGALKKSPPAVPTSRSVRSMSDLVEALQEWADWLESDPQDKFVADRIGEGREITRLSQQLRKASERIIESLSNLKEKKH